MRHSFSTHACLHIHSQRNATFTCHIRDIRNLMPDVSPGRNLVKLRILMVVLPCSVSVSAAVLRQPATISEASENPSCLCRPMPGKAGVGPIATSSNSYRQKGRGSRKRRRSRSHERFQPRYSRCSTTVFHAQEEQSVNITSATSS